mgnify:CR=1 FL=1
MVDPPIHRVIIMGAEYLAFLQNTKKSFKTLNIVYPKIITNLLSIGVLAYEFIVLYYWDINSNTTQAEYT